MDCINVMSVSREKNIIEGVFEVQLLKLIFMYSSLPFSINICVSFYKVVLIMLIAKNVLNLANAIYKRFEFYCKICIAVTDFE